ncbi:MAG: NAD(P)-dependent oxidoreductase [Chloroflexota bacterium]|nr:NAD(P)-dependent oxidoreductase [Chloroflexota bacterium]
MRVLVIGGGGYVAGLVLPALAQQHALRVFDLHAAADLSGEYVAGSVTDLDALLRAVDGMEAVLYMAMGAKEFVTSTGITTNLDVNIKGVYLALYAAHQAGIAHAVYTSSMSVYGGDLMTRYFPDEEISPDASDLYGLSKRLGEEVCRNATRAWGMSVNALRLCFPQPDDSWQAEARPGIPTIATAGSDVASALLAALDYRGGFEAFMISGDYAQKVMNMAKAQRLLGWAPLARPRTET